MAEQQRVPVLDYPHAAERISAPRWQVVVARTFAGLCGVALLVFGATFTLGAAYVIPEMISDHVRHPHDPHWKQDVVAGVVIVLIAGVSDWVSVRWLSFSIRGKRRLTPNRILRANPTSVAESGS